MFEFLFNFRKKRKVKPKLGLALSGGAARGIVHLGVIKALCENNIPISSIAGVSCGSLIGGLFCAGLPIDQLIVAMKKVRWYDLAGFHLSKKGMVSSRRLEKYVKSLVGSITFKEMPIPFSALTTDILKGEGVVLNDPDMLLSTAIRASASFPGVYAPVKVNDTYYIDGGSTNNIPVDEARDLGADFIIAVDAVPDVVLDKLPENLAKIADRSLDLLLHKNSLQNYSHADLLLKPVKEPISSFDIHRGDDLLSFGESAVLDNLALIQDAVC